MMLMLSNMSVPSGEPTHLSLTVYNSTSIHLMWSPPLEMYQNGVLTNYSIIISNLENGNSSTLSVHSLAHSMVFHQLHPYTTYGFAVAAENSAGVGPFTSVMYARTSEDGAFYPFLYISKYVIFTPTIFSLQNIHFLNQLLLLLHKTLQYIMLPQHHLL